MKVQGTLWLVVDINGTILKAEVTRELAEDFRRLVKTLTYVIAVDIDVPQFRNLT